MHKMVILSKIKPHFDAVNYFKELPFIKNSSKNETLNA